MVVVFNKIFRCTFKTFDLGRGFGNYDSHQGRGLYMDSNRRVVSNFRGEVRTHMGEGVQISLKGTFHRVLNLFSSN